MSKHQRQAPTVRRSSVTLASRGRSLLGGGRSEEHLEFLITEGTIRASASTARFLAVLVAAGVEKYFKEVLY